jgi:pimeloyl-ACP methyl ester carboxylesterase
LFLLGAFGALIVGTDNALAAQSPALPTQTLAVDGVAMRIAMAGMEGRRPGQPVVILEAGAGDPGSSPLDTWRRVFPEIARLAPVLAYERRGNGMSEPDSERPTMRRVAFVLHALLDRARVGPPYVLLGQSWGGNYIRAFYDLYPNEVVGMIFVDAETGIGPTREERAAVLPADQRAAALAPPVLPPMPPNIPAGLRAEFEEPGKEMISDGAEARTLRRVSGIPVAVVMATPPGRLRGNGGAVTRLTIRHTSDWVLTLPNAIFVTANHVGHHVHVDDPPLVARLVEHVLDHVGVRTRNERVGQPQR